MKTRFSFPLNLLATQSQSGRFSRSFVAWRVSIHGEAFQAITSVDEVFTGSFTQVTPATLRFSSGAFRQHFDCREARQRSLNSSAPRGRRRPSSKEDLYRSAA
jgi:hypothetical protein